MPPETLGSRPGSVETGRDREVCGVCVGCTIGLASSGLRRAWPRTSDSCGGPGAVHANQGYQVHSFSSHTSGLDKHCVKKQCGLVGLCIRGRMALNLRLSRNRTGVVAMRQDSSYELDTTKKGLIFLYKLKIK